MSALSNSAALWLLTASCGNNGGGLPDCGHLYGETDCGRSCEAPDGEPCLHGYLGARDSAEALGWITNEDNVTDAGVAAMVSISLV